MPFEKRQPIMSDSITLNVPAEISAKAQAIAAHRQQSAEQVLLDYLQMFPEPTVALTPEEERELNALQYLSDDTLWTIASEQMPEAAQARATELFSQETLSDAEQAELDALVLRSERLTLRKAEAATILRKRGHPFKQADFKPKNG
jgi:uncharacterized protein (DUF1684 family)